MREYGLQKDLDIYKSLLNIFPKGPLIPQNAFQVSSLLLCISFRHLRTIFAAARIRLFSHVIARRLGASNLDPRVQPDKEVHDIVVNVFGEWNFATKKIKRMMYWMPKLKHSNKYLDRRKIEGKKLSGVDLGYLALKMISRDPGTRISFAEIGDVEQKSWLLSAQSPQQAKLLHALGEGASLYVDGPSKVYLMDHCVDYVVLSADPKTQYYEKYDESSAYDEDFENWKSEWDEGVARHPRVSTIHEQKHETILALSVFEKVSRESAVAWINHLQSSNPTMHNARVLLRTKQAERTLITPIS
ncbi:unnamed protein product [Gongylonema pulchrum]|uniref:Evolutionarily conserved signaling intermediate in Toll pathway, mitochondrial n=1 Tax=Gongylonema pulchrum TaxID=637853 RepID=A0A183E7J0_9BILA|nr:unnamed protein product [Gongylonema pulchrum]